MLVCYAGKAGNTLVTIGVLSNTCIKVKIQSWVVVLVSFMHFKQLFSCKRDIRDIPVIRYQIILSR